MKPLNYQDITLKARVENEEEVERKLLQLGANFLGTDHQTDYYFKTHRGKLKYRQGTIETLITHYERLRLDGVEKTRVYRYDVNPSPADLKILFRGVRIGITRKQRKIFTLDPIKVHLDCLENGTRFLEIEVIDRENKWSFDHLKNLCFELKEKLGISDNDLLPTGYLTTNL